MGIEKEKIPCSSAQEVWFTASTEEQEVSVNGYCAIYSLDFHYKFTHDLKKLKENINSKLKYIFEISRTP